MQLGITASKPITSYIKSAVTFVDNPDGSPILKLVDPTTGIHHRDVESFVASLKTDPDFRPKPAAIAGEQPPRHIHQDALLQERPSLEDIARGRVIVDMPEVQPLVEMKENEVSRRDQRAINNNIEKIARGEVVIGDMVIQK